MWGLHFMPRLRRAGIKAHDEPQTEHPSKVGNLLDKMPLFGKGLPTKNIPQTHPKGEAPLNHQLSTIRVLLKEPPEGPARGWETRATCKRAAPPKAGKKGTVH